MVRFKRRYKNSDRTGTIRVPVSPHNLKNQVEHFAQLLDLGFPIECQVRDPNKSIPHTVIYTCQGIHEDHEFTAAQPPIRILEVDKEKDLEEYIESIRSIEDLIGFNDEGDFEDEPPPAADENDIVEPAIEATVENSDQHQVESDFATSIEAIKAEPALFIEIAEVAIDTIELTTIVESVQKLSELPDVAAAPIDAPDVQFRIEQPIELPEQSVEPACSEPIETPIELPNGVDLTTSADEEVAPIVETPVPNSIVQFAQQLFDQWQQMASQRGDSAIPWKTPVSVEAIYEERFRHMSAFVFLSYLDTLIAQELNPQQRLVLVRSTANQSYIEFLTFSTSAVAATPLLKPIVAAAPVMAEVYPSAFTEPSTPIPPVSFEYLDRLRAFAACNCDYAEEAEPVQPEPAQPEPLAAPSAPFWGLFRRNR